MSTIPVYRSGARTPARPAARSRQHTRRRAMQVHDQPTLSYYARPAGMTSAGRHPAPPAPPPPRIARLAPVAPGPLLPQHQAHGHRVPPSAEDPATPPPPPPRPTLVPALQRPDDRHAPGAGHASPGPLRVRRLLRQRRVRGPLGLRVLAHGAAALGLGGRAD